MNVIRRFSSSVSGESLLTRASAPSVYLYNYLRTGPVSYEKAWKWQQEIMRIRTHVDSSIAESCNNALIVLEHAPVYTLGRAASPSDLRFSTSHFEQTEGASLPPPPFACDVHKVERGGKITYHGPGQLVVYPMLNLREFRLDLHWYVESIEETIIRMLRNIGIGAARLKGFPGVWVGGEIEEMHRADTSGRLVPKTVEGTGLERKIAQVGMNCSKWYTSHGFAINVCPSMDHFNYIVPCGISDRAVTSIMQEMERQLRNGGLISKYIESLRQNNANASSHSILTPKSLMTVVEKLVLREFQHVFECSLVDVPHGVPPIQVDDS